MSKIMDAKAAGFIVALILAMAPAAIMFFNDASDAGLVTATTAGIAVLIINSIVKVLQLKATDTAQPEAPAASMSRGAMPTMHPKSEAVLYQSKLSKFLLG